MKEITIHQPEQKGNTVWFRWSVDPPSPLYVRTEFFLKFPNGLDLSLVSNQLWWRIALICLHSHWPVLRPCRITIPVRLRSGEKEVWLRLLRAQCDSLDKYAGNAFNSDSILEIVEGEQDAGPWKPAQDAGKCATSFSGGKDSLVQAGLLSEMGLQPTLVTTTSTMPGLGDHITQRRKFILREIVRRIDVSLVEVESDYRSILDHAFASTQGYRISVNEITDTFLYFACLLAAALAIGASHLFLASETEVQENREVEGRIIQHPHNMYAVTTQAVLQGMIEPAGIHFSSLTSPLHSYQVQDLLWNRYIELRDLQYSCWKVTGDDWVCSACSNCLRAAFAILANGGSPLTIGIDLAKLLIAMRGWTPARLEQPVEEALPDAAVRSSIHAQIARSICRTSLQQISIELSKSSSRMAPSIAQSSGLEAMLSYKAIEEAAARLAPDAAPGYRPGFLPWVDPLVRDKLNAIYSSCFSEQCESDYADALRRSRKLSEWLLEPIGGYPGK